MRELNHECSIYPISETLIEGSDAYEMLQRFPNAGSHDGINYVFAGAPENPTDAKYIPKVENELPDKANKEAFIQANLGRPNGLLGLKSEIHEMYLDGVLGDITSSDL